MQIPALFLEVQVNLIADKQFVTTMTKTDSVGVHLITVTQMYAVEATADKGCNRICGTISNSSVQQFVLVLIDQSCRNISAIDSTVITHYGIGRYS